MKKNKSAIKKAKQSEERRVRNAHIKTGMKTQIKKALASFEAHDKENVGATLKSVIASIDKASSKGVIHKNNAARKVSRLAKKANKILQPKN